MKRLICSILSIAVCLSFANMLSVSAKNDGDIAQSVVNEDGTAYSTYAPNNAWSGNDITGCEFNNSLSVATASSFVTASLTGTKKCTWQRAGIYAERSMRIGRRQERT